MNKVIRYCIVIIIFIVLMVITNYTAQWVFRGNNPILFTIMFIWYMIAVLTGVTLSKLDNKLK
jgi:hypothetical protein